MCRYSDSMSISALHPYRFIKGIEIHSQAPSGPCCFNYVQTLLQLERLGLLEGRQCKQ